MRIQLQIWVNSYNQGLTCDCCVVQVSHMQVFFFNSTSDMGPVCCVSATQVTMGDKCRLRACEDKSM